MSTIFDEDRVRLGATDIMISPLGLGAWSWGDSWFWGYGRKYGHAEVKAAFDAAISAGVNFIDTAEVYGHGVSETLVGRFTKHSAAETVVATKFFPFPWRLSKWSFDRALHLSLRRLGVDRIDLYQMHWPFPPVAIETWMDAMADAVQAGLIRAVGVSNYDLAQTRRACEALAKRGLSLASNQVEYSLLHRQPERAGLLQFCSEHNITVIAYSPIAKGVLCGKYSPAHAPSGIHRRKYDRALLARVQPLVGLMRQIGEAHGGKCSAQVALNWVICKGAIPIPGAKNALQAQENAGALGWRLSEDEVAALDAASAEF